MRSPPGILILAAGASTRMRGSDKLLEEIDGTPLILRAVRAACAVSSVVSVVLPAADRARRAWLADCPVQMIDVTDRAMAASISAGVAVTRTEALMIHLADMPEIGVVELEALSDAWQRGKASILRGATVDGKPGHPTVFDKIHYPTLRRLRGDQGARDLIRTHGADLVPLPGDAARVDLDTPEEWQAWRAARAI